MDVDLGAVFACQDGLVTREKALGRLSDDALRWRLGRQWRVALPGIYSCSNGPLSSRQRLRAALLHAGPTAILSDTSALGAFRLPFVPPDDRIRLLVADNVQRLSRDFVVVRRTANLPQPVLVAGLPTAPAARAVCEFVLRHADQRDCIAVAAAAVQLQRTTVQELLAVATQGPARGRSRLLRVIRALQDGIRSAPEADFMELVRRSRRIPEPLWNCLLQLPSGLKVSPDAFWKGSRVVHEVNGRRYHSPELAGEDVFEDMQRRNDAMVAAGLVVLHNSPNRILTEGRDVVGEVATCVSRNAGLGLPPGVVLLRPGPPGTPVSGHPSNATLLPR